ncbi:hypothetical protein [Microbacterium sp. LWH12-1.2]|uniref:hypothetical protein n=1 Tax=Microbacterium sp. LWH12-1.2 TaxID=3135259 RepID=UPI00342C70BC
MEYLSIDVPVWLWQRVDGCVDNSMAVDVVESVLESVSIGSCVRDEGWRVAASFVGETDEHGWPPQDHPLPVVLQCAHWEWVLTQLDRWMPYEDDDAIAQARDLIQESLHSP